MITFRVSGRRLAFVSAVVTVVVVGGIGFAAFSRGAHADTPTPDACAAAGAAAGCTVVYAGQYSGHSAYVQFSQTDNNSICPTTTYTGVFAGEIVQKTTPVPPTSGPDVTVQIYQMDCNGAIFYDAVGDSSNVTITAPGADLKSASAVATVPITDFYTNATTEVTVNLSWVGTGQVSRGVWVSHEQRPDYLIDFHQIGTARAALVSGSVVSGATDYASGSSAMGTLGLNDSGSLYMTR
jgi:hypothetical protein